MQDLQWEFMMKFYIEQQIFFVILLLKNRINVFHFGKNMDNFTHNIFRIFHEGTDFLFIAIGIVIDREDK